MTTGRWIGVFWICLLLSIFDLHPLLSLLLYLGVLVSVAMVIAIGADRMHRQDDDDSF